jgi:VIT1/CCC1 family predicted Fe2+/Mn2+ transporter
MGVGNYLGIRAEKGSRELQRLPEAEASPARHGLATFLAFVAAGILPLAPYLSSGTPDAPLTLSVGVTLTGLFGVGRAFGLQPGVVVGDGAGNAQSRNGCGNGRVRRRRAGRSLASALA